MATEEEKRIKDLEFQLEASRIYYKTLVGQIAERLTLEAKRLTLASKQLQSLACRTRISADNLHSLSFRISALLERDGMPPAAVKLMKELSLIDAVEEEK